MLNTLLSAISHSSSIISSSSHNSRIKKSQNIIDNSESSNIHNNESDSFTKHYRKVNFKFTFGKEKVLTLNENFIICKNVSIFLPNINKMRISKDEIIKENYFLYRENNLIVKEILCLYNENSLINKKIQELESEGNIDKYVIERNEKIISELKNEIDLLTLIAEKKEKKKMFKSMYISSSDQGNINLLDVNKSSKEKKSFFSGLSSFEQGIPKKSKRTLSIISISTLASTSKFIK